MRAFIASLLISLCSNVSVSAGITIHYEGSAVSAEAVTNIIAKITAAAKTNRWKIEDASAVQGRLQRVIDEKDKDYQGKITGVVVRIVENCEPLHFQFGDDLFMQDFVKTQFAGPEVHIQIIRLFESIRPHFKKLTIDDEGEYWETHNKTVLVSHIEKINSRLADIKQKDPGAKGPVTLKTGRIADVIR